MKSLKVSSVAVDRLERKAGKKRRKKRHNRGEPYPLEKTASGGGKKSKNKGTGFENDIAKLFAAYYGCNVRRTPGSGGWATVGSFGPKGDLVFSDRKCPFTVECKKQEGWELTDFLSGKRSLDTTSTNSVEKWWKQTVEETPRKKIPLLVFAKNHVAPLLMLRQRNYDKLARRVVHGEGESKTYWMPEIQHMQLTDDDGVRVVMLLSDFFKYVRPPKQSPRRKEWRHGHG